MSVLRKHIAVRVMAIVTAGTFVSACTTWHTQSLQPGRFSTPDSTPQVRLTLASGDRLIVLGPVITGDSLVGMGTRLGASPDLLERVSVPVAAIEKAEVRGVSTGAVVVAVLGGALLVVALATMPACYGLGCK